MITVRERAFGRVTQGNGHMHEAEDFHEILLVEDNPADVTLFEMAFPAEKKVRVWNVSTGRKALDFLYRRGGFAHAPRPHLVFLDLNLPVVDGREVLETVKADSDLKRIPIIVLSTSESRADISGSYHRGANSYMVKPGDINRLFSMMSACCDYWFGTVVLDD